METAAPRVCVIVLNWNGADDSLKCIDSLKNQSEKHIIIAVDNGSTDDFVARLQKEHPDVILLQNKRNLGFAGGVNTGLRYAIEKNFSFAALLNNDALPGKTWLEALVKEMKDGVGIVTGKLLRINGTIDSTGECYTSWGLAYPRGRDEADTNQYDQIEEVFGASGGASLYRIEMLKQIDLFDEDFFLYYEDVDVSFRAQLAGWKVMYTPNAIAHHKIGASSDKLPGITTYQTAKNLPWLLWKNVPWRFIPVILPRFFVAHLIMILSATSKCKFIPVTKGLFMAFWLFPKKLIARHRIQQARKADNDHIRNLIIWDLPPSAAKLRRLRSVFKRSKA